MIPIVSQGLFDAESTDRFVLSTVVNIITGLVEASLDVLWCLVETIQGLDRDGQRGIGE